MFTQETYTTPEGFELPRKILLPDVRTFEEVLTFVRPWDHATMSHTSGNVPEPALVPDPVKIGENELGPFCSFRNMPDRKAHTSAAVMATDLTVQAIAPRIVTDDDRLSFQVIYHQANDRCLVLAEHNYIIGSHWLAYIDPASVPAFES